jgi:hypothetical protein
MKTGWMNLIFIFECALLIGSQQKVLYIGLHIRPIEFLQAFMYSEPEAFRQLQLTLIATANSMEGLMHHLLLASTRSSADRTKKWLQARKGNQLNYPFTKLVISQPIKSGKEIPFGFRWLRFQ